MSMTNIEILTHWFTELWCKGNLSIVSELMDENTHFEGFYRDQKIEFADVPEMVASVRNLINHVTFNLDHYIEQGEWVAASFTFGMKDAKSDHHFSIGGQAMLHIRNGKICTYSSSLDLFKFFEELGQLPPETLPVCMTGQKLVWADIG